MINSGIISSRHRSDGFISIWETSTANETIVLPYKSDEIYTGTIDWGDGTVVSNTFANSSHTYTNAGQYVITIKGQIPSFVFNNTGDVSKIKNIVNFNGLLLDALQFYGCDNLVLSASDVPLVKGDSLATLFRDASSLTSNSKINEWDVSTVENLANTFRSASSFNSPIGGWDVSSVNNMQSVFFQATSFNQDLSSWNTSNVDRMDNMFRQATSFNQDISSWDFSNVTRLNAFMLSKSSANYDASFYDNLLIKWDDELNGGLVFSNMANVNISMGTIKYTSAGAAARASLVTKGFIITDGGLV